MILGNSGTGKSASMRNLDPAKTGLINVAKKPLPFRGSLKSLDTDEPKGSLDYKEMAKQNAITADQWKREAERLRRLLDADKPCQLEDNRCNDCPTDYPNKECPDFIEDLCDAELNKEIARLRQLVVEEYARGFRDGVKIGEDKMDDEDVLKFSTRAAAILIEAAEKRGKTVPMAFLMEIRGVWFASDCSTRIELREIAAKYGYEVTE